tara:strand:- start:221 stop:508 length:288 start_codon:yes stop_codon:yes gene_type:complete
MNRHCSRGLLWQTLAFHASNFARPAESLQELHAILVVKQKWRNFPDMGKIAPCISFIGPGASGCCDARFKPRGYCQRVAFHAATRQSGKGKGKEQ